MTPGQITRVKSVLAAFTEGKLINQDRDEYVYLIAAMEQEGYGTDITTLETLLSLRDIYQEHNLEFDAMVFTDEHVEVHEDDLKHLTQALLRLVTYTVAIDDIKIDWPPLDETKGKICIKLNNVEHVFACEFFGKYTPIGLIEGIASLMPNEHTEHLYYENLDSSIVVVRITPESANVFNSRMRVIDDPLRLYPVKLEKKDKKENGGISRRVD